MLISKKFETIFIQIWNNFHTRNSFGPFRSISSQNNARCQIICRNFGNTFTCHSHLCNSNASKVEQLTRQFYDAEFVHDIFLRALIRNMHSAFLFYGNFEKNREFISCKSETKIKQKRGIPDPEPDRNREKNSQFCAALVSI